MRRRKACVKGNLVPLTMRAVEFDQYGPSDVLKVRHVPRPIPGPGEALVRIDAVTVNPIDTIIRSGRLKVRTGSRFPKRTGIDFAGTIAAVVEADPHLAVGDHVWGVMPLTIEKGFGQGSAAEYVTIAASRLAKSPACLDAVQSAALSSVGAVAIETLRDRAKLRGGERLLVRGGAGGVGTIAVQLGRGLGADVTVLASQPDLSVLRELGATTALDYRATKPTDLSQFDVILDLVGTELPAFRRLLSPHGRMFCLALTSLASIAYIQFSRIYGSKRVRFFSAAPLRPAMQDLSAYAAVGTLKPIVHGTYSLDDIAQAQRPVEAGGGRGKRVVIVSPCDRTSVGAE